MKTKMQMVLFILLLGGIFTTALVVVDDFTAPIIEKNRILKEKSGVLRAFQIDFSKDNIEKVFEREVTVRESDGETYYVTDNGETAFGFKGPGLWGEIRGVVSLTPDLTTIYGIAITYQEETPGLGSRIAEKSYLDDFKGKQFLPKLKLILAGKESTPDGIDVITGATISSEKFVTLLNERHENIMTFMKGAE